MYPPLMSQTLIEPSELPVASNVPVSSTADATTGVVWGFNVLRSVRLLSKRTKLKNLMDSDLEHTIICDAEGVIASEVMASPS